jgi:DHA1 family tetracycline resistance protein-like MFS transporter
MKRSPLVAILLTVFIALVGFGIVIPLLPIYAKHMGASGTTVGLLLMSYSLMQFLLAPTMGKLSDRLGRRPVILAALVVTVLSYLLLAVADNLPMLFASRILAGIGGADITVAQAYIADVTTRENRAKGMGLFGAAFGFGFMVGPIMGASLTHAGGAAPALTAAGFAFFTLVFAAFALREPQRHEAPLVVRGVGAVRGMAAGALALIAVNFAAILVQGQFQSMLVLFTHERFHWGERENGYYLGLFGLVAVIVQGGLVGRISKKVGPTPMIRGGLVLIGTGMIIASLAHSAVMMAAGGMINAVGFSLVLPSLTALSSLSAAADQQGRVLGVFQSTGSLARIAAPLLGGFLFDRVGPAAPLVAGGIIALVTAAASVPALRWVPIAQPQAAE